MKPITFLAFQLLAVLLMLNCYAEAKDCLGCFENVDPNDPELRKNLVGVLAVQNKDDNIIQVIRAKRQIVSGVRYIVDFIVREQRTKNLKECHTSFISQPWISKLPLVQEFSCHYRLGF